MRSIQSLAERFAVLTALVSPAVSMPARAGEAQPPPLSRADLAAILFERVTYDEPGDGAIWARGEHYKASFGPRGAEYIPAFGPNSPRDEVLNLSPRTVHIDGRPLVFATGVHAHRESDRVEFQRGSFVERYDLALGNVKQSFIFDSLPARGEIKVEIPVGSTLEAQTSETGLEFVGEYGRVTYDGAVAFDADGRRGAVHVEYEAGSIVLRVDAAFVRNARLPLVLDPYVAAGTLTSAGGDYFSPDTAWSASDGAWLVVSTFAYSATDNDVYAIAVQGNFTSGTAAWVDVTMNSWNLPRCAAIPAQDRVLVVAEQSTAVPTGIWGRMVSVSNLALTFGNQFDIAGTLGGDKSAPDVGGDPSPSGIRYACVAWTRTNSSLDSDIGYALVDANGAIQAGPTYLSHVSGTEDSSVSVSKSNGGTDWLLAWQKSDPSSFSRTDILAARVTWNGAIQDNTFPVATTLLFEYAPSASSPLAGTARNVIVFNKNPLAPTQSDIGAVALDGTTVLQYVDLSILENEGYQALDQKHPSVDCDGQHFLVAYSEKVQATGLYGLFSTDLFLSGNILRTKDGHGEMFYNSSSAMHGQVAATGGVSATSNRYVIAFDAQLGSTHRRVGVVAWDGESGGSNELFCYGDGTGTACPCGNSGASTHGCAHSASAIGGWLLQTSGVASVASDNVLIQVGNVPTSAPCLFFQGTAQGAGSAFGDGLLCATGTITRLAVVFASGVTASCPIGVASLGAVPASGGLRSYQAWFRDSSSSFCTASTFNLSNGLAIYWVP